MRLTRYKDFIIINSSIWFDRSDYKDCRSFMSFKTKNQAIEYIDKFHNNYYLEGGKYVLKKIGK